VIAAGRTPAGIADTVLTDDLRERTDDSVWRVRWGKDWVYVYLLLEFQSRIDRFMAVRIMTYVGLLYQDLLRQGVLSSTDRLPPVLPAVLYNGESRCRAEQNVADLIERVPGGLERYCPSLAYLRLDEGRIIDDPALTPPASNLVAALFRLEHNRDEQDMLTVLGGLIKWLRADDQTSLRRAFAVWIKRVLLPSRLPDMTEFEQERFEELQEIHTMLSERIKQWPDRWIQKGLEQGLERGVRKGLELGREKTARRMLQGLIVRKYGSVPGWAQTRLDQAGIEQLEAWVDAILDAETLEALLGELPGDD